MGGCQSQAIDPEVADTGRGNACDTQKPNTVQTPNVRGGKARLFGIKANSKIPAYELALVSPSEHTHATLTMTPFSSSPAMSQSEIQKGNSYRVEHSDDVSELDVPFDEEEGEDGLLLVPSDEEGDLDDEEMYLNELYEGCIAVSPLSTHHFDDEKPDTPNFSYMVTPSTARKAKLSLFSRSIKKERPSGEMVTPRIILNDDDDGDELVDTPEPVIPINNAPLLAPPKETDVTFDSVPNPSPHQQQLSVNPQTLASFNKMRTEVHAAEKHEFKRRQQEKIKDRRHDLQGYNELWDEFRTIQEKMSQWDQHENPDDGVHQTNGETISIHDATSWIVDFSTLNTNDLSDDSEEDDGEKSQSSFSLHSEMSERAQRRLFKEKAKKRRLSSTAAKALSCPDDLDDTGSVNDEEMESTFPGGKKSVVMNDANSSISDFSSDNGSVAERNDDYGVLQKFRYKSIEQSVMEYTTYFEDTPHRQTEMGFPSIQSAVQDVNPVTLEEVQGSENSYADAPTPKTVNSRPASIEAYLAEMCLPSVTIESAETGVVRWRKFPKNEEKAKTARKLEFQLDSNQQNLESKCGSKASPKPEKGTSKEKKDVDATNEPCTPHVKKTKPQIKMFHPMISAMSKEDFLRVSSWGNCATAIEGEKEIETSWLKTSAIVSGLKLSIVEDGVKSSPECKNDCKEPCDLLARKVGTKLAGLVAQLKENGLGE